MESLNATRQSYASAQAIYYGQALADNKKLTAANPAIRIGG
jgi:hypothetical protein